METEGADYCFTSVRELAGLMHQGKNTVDRALTWLRKNEVCIGFLVLKEKTEGGEVLKFIKWDTQNSPETKGWKAGQRMAPNWSKLREFRSIHMGENASLDHLGGDVSQVGGGKGVEQGRGSHTGVDPNSSSPLVDSRVLDSLISEMNSRFRYAASLRGMPNPTDMVYGRAALRGLRGFVGGNGVEPMLSPKGRWTAVARTLNLFTFWVENHARKNLKSPVEAFIAQHGQFLNTLERWEDANPTVDFVALPTHQPEEKSSEVKQISEFLFLYFHVSCSEEDIALALQRHTAEEVQNAICYWFGDPMSEVRSVSMTKENFRAFCRNIDTVLHEKKQVDN